MSSLLRSSDAAPAGATAPVGLRRILGIGFGLAVIVGSILGIGILRTPGLVAAQLHHPSTILLVWLIGGLYTLLGAACLAELGTMLPQAGGYYVYARRAFGNSVGFAVGWTDWLTYCSVLGYVSIAIGEFAGVLLPFLAPWAKAVAILALVLLVLLQWMGLRVSSRFQEVTTALKFVAFLVLVAVGLVIALQSVAITYGGWQSAMYFTEEDRDPGRNLPRSMMGGIVSVTVVYLLVNIALLRVLPVPDLARSTLPATDAAQRVLGSAGGTLITVLSLISLPPLLNAIMMVGTRILFAMGRDGLLWRRTATVNTGGTPGVATVITTAVAVALIATGTFQKLVAVASFFLAANYCVCCVALFVLRRREPDLPRPFRAWGYPWSAVVVLLGAAAFLVGTFAGDTANALLALLLVAAGLVVHVVVEKLRPPRAAARGA
jgi:APA family basic amino acid/polyamine antiporter